MAVPHVAMRKRTSNVEKVDRFPNSSPGRNRPGLKRRMPLPAYATRGPGSGPVTFGGVIFVDLALKRPDRHAASGIGCRQIRRPALGKAVVLGHRSDAQMVRFYAVSPATVSRIVNKLHHVQPKEENML